MSADGGPRVKSHLDAVAVSTLIVCCFVWGLNQVAVKVANDGLQPVFQAGLRSLLGGVLVFGWCRVRRIPLFERDGTMAAGLIAGVLFAAEFIFGFIGLDFTTVSRGIVFFYTMPLIVALGAHVFIPGERLTLAKTAGLVAAFAGVVIVAADRLSLPSPRALIGDALCFGGAVAWAATTLVIKRTRLATASAEKVLVYQLAVSTVVLFAVAPFYGPFVRSFDGLAAAALAYQVVFVVGGSYLAWFWLLGRYPASQLSSFTFLTPIFAVALGWLLLRDPVSPWLFLALALVAFGIYLANRSAEPA